MLFELMIILAFSIIGAGLKYIDDAFDEGTFSKKKAIMVAPVIVLIWIVLSLYDPISATILFSIFLAVLLTGKIDNSIFMMCSIAIIAILLLTQMLTLLWIPLFLMTLAGIIDEKGNDYVDYHESSKLIQFFFTYRCCMKVGVLSLCIVIFIPWLYLFAFLAHDVSYELVRRIGLK
jgi:hypothetical protein